MNKKFLSIILAIVLTITSFIALPTNTQAASYKSAYKKALTTTISGGIYSKYAYIKMKGFSKPVMMVIMNDWSSEQSDTIPMAKFYCYKNGKVKKIGNIELESWVERDDWKVKRKGKKYVISYASNGFYVNYVIQTKKGKVSSVRYDCNKETINGKTWAGYSKWTGKNLSKFKEISKSAYNKAVKTTKKVKLKEHFAEHEY